MILALLETDVACCTFYVDYDETVRAIENAEKQEERSHQHKSRLCAANKKEYIKSLKGER